MFVVVDYDQTTVTRPTLLVFIPQGRLARLLLLSPSSYTACLQMCMPWLRQQPQRTPLHLVFF
jgi:hypothetical protein